MKIGDLVWARWQDDCFGIVIDTMFDEINVEHLYRVKWWGLGFGICTHETLEYIEDLLTKEEKCSKQEI
jgi:hypothetical protein